VRDVSPSIFVGRFVAVGYVTKENDAPATAGFVKYVSFGDPEG
jgi:hypothetical protein